VKPDEIQKEKNRSVAAFESGTEGSGLHKHKQHMSLHVSVTNDAGDSPLAKRLETDKAWARKVKRVEKLLFVFVKT
jgi:hypothetical protein